MYCKGNASSRVWLSSLTSPSVQGSSTFSAPKVTSTTTFSDRARLYSIAVDPCLSATVPPFFELCTSHKDATARPNRQRNSQYIAQKLDSKIIAIVWGSGCRMHDRCTGPEAYRCSWSLFPTADRPVRGSRLRGGCATAPAYGSINKAEQLTQLQAAKIST
jgi:hypothetical protein